MGVGDGAAMLPSRTALRDRLNEALRSLQEDGTIEALQEEYIDKIIAGQDPAPIRMKKNKKWDTIRVAKARFIEKNDKFQQKLVVFCGGR